VTAASMSASASSEMAPTKTEEAAKEENGEKAKLEEDAKDVPSSTIPAKKKAKKVKDEDEDEEEPHQASSKKKVKKASNKDADGDEEDGEDATATDGEGELVEDNVVTYVHGKRPLRGRVWRRNGECLRYHCDNSDLEYGVGDAVYVESETPEQPYHICIIEGIKMSKRDAVSVIIKWFYRTSEVPEQVYQLLIQDRHTEHGQGQGHPPTRSKVDIAAMNDPMYRTRELFIAEKAESKNFSVGVLRGKCRVLHCLDIASVKEFRPEDDTFFYTLSYNSETRRLASTQGEIRVGASHQAKLPKFEGEVPLEKRPDPKGEDVSWCPERIHDHDLLMFLRAARSMAAFAAMYDGGSPEDGFTVCVTCVL